MAKTLKFSISMPAPEFRALETARSRAGRTRSQFVREAVGAIVQSAPAVRSVREDRSSYGSPCPSDLTDMAELRRRAIEAAGRFESGVPDLSVEHDRYLTDDLPRMKDETPGPAKKDGRPR